MLDHFEKTDRENIEIGDDYEIIHSENVMVEKPCLIQRHNFFFFHDLMALNKFFKENLKTS